MNQQQDSRPVLRSTAVAAGLASLAAFVNVSCIQAPPNCAAGTATGGGAVASSSSSSSSSGGGTKATAVAAAPVKKCKNPKPAAEGLIDDCEDGDGQLLIVKGNGAGWMSYPNGQAQVEPMVCADEGANGSTKAARVLGHIEAGQGNSATMGLGFGKNRLDASAYGGIRFWAKAGEETGTTLNVSIGDVNTEPGGNVCTACWDRHQTDIQLTHEWKEYTVLFSDVAQGGWGAPQGPLEVKALSGINFNARDAGMDFDIWVDDLTFLSCD